MFENYQRIVALQNDAKQMRRFYRIQHFHNQYENSVHSQTEHSVHNQNSNPYLFTTKFGETIPRLSLDQTFPKYNKQREELDFNFGSWRPVPGRSEWDAGKTTGMTVLDSRYTTSDAVFEVGARKAAQKQRGWLEKDAEEDAEKTNKKTRLDYKFESIENEAARTSAMDHEGPFICQVCNKNFEIQYELKLHFR